MTKEEFEKRTDELNQLTENLVLTIIDERDKDPNSHVYPVKKNFKFVYYDGEKKNWDMYNVGLYMLVEMQRGKSYDPYAYVEKMYFYVDDSLLEKMLAVRDDEALLFRKLLNIDTNIKLQGKAKEEWLKERIENWNNRKDRVLIQTKNDTREPFTAVVGEEDVVTEGLTKLFSEKKIEGYEIWSGAGQNTILDSFSVEHDVKVWGIPERASDFVIYPVGYRMGRNVLSLKEAQRLLFFGRVTTTYRKITDYGTGFRTEITALPKNVEIKEGTVWVCNDPLD